ncbi:MAG TPA: crosslink repair DNA glycosylase YcaQ family protein, partial [Phytomonospora sp.]
MDLRAARMTAQALTRPLPTSRDVVRHLVGVQAQSPWVAPYVIRPRLAAGAALAASDVVRTWAMRGTLHMVAAEDAGWLVALLGPVFAARTRPRRLQLGLAEDLLGRAVDAVVAALPATRDELLAVMADVGVPEGQARAHVLSYVCMSGSACLDGPDGELFTAPPATVSP